jgi:zinc transport system substrate-binding protein
MFDFAQKIGGDKVEVTNMVPSGMEPHDWEPTPLDIVTLENTDVFVYNGAGMEHWVEDVLASLSSKSLITVEASNGITLMEGHGHEHEEGEDHEEDHEEDEHAFDPHVWLSPSNAKIEMENIKNAFVQAHPEDAAYFEANFETWAKELDALDKEFKDALSPFAGKDIIVAHQAFGYLCAAYGLNQVAIEGLSPDSEPDPARVAEIIDFAKEHAVKVIFFEELVSPKVAETIAKAIGAKTDVLSPVEGLSDEQLASGGDYFSAMRQNLKALTAALA